MTNGNPFYVHPGTDFGPGLRGLAGTISQIGEQKRAEAEKERMRAVREEGVEALRSGDPSTIREYIVRYPEAGASLKQALDLKLPGTSGDAYKKAVFSTAIDFSRAPQELERLRVQFAKDGIDPEEQAKLDNFQSLLDTDPENAKRAVESELAIFADETQWKRYQDVTKAEKEDAGSKIKVGAQEILEDGTIIQSTAKGPIVYNPYGERVKGKDAAHAVALARAQKVANLREAAGEKKRATLEAEDELKAKVEAGVISAKEAAKISVKAFDRLEKINTNISNLGEGIRLLDEGAATGAVTKFLPSARAASLKLDNLQGRLGLDILHSTTFGALSAAELRFALSTALPQRLNEPELRKWLEDKKAAQEKLADYIESAAIYLGTPGNTVAGWMEKQKEKRETPPDKPASEMTEEELRKVAFGVL